MEMECIPSKSERGNVEFLNSIQKKAEKEKKENDKELKMECKIRIVAVIFNISVIAKVNELNFLLGSWGLFNWISIKPSYIVFMKETP